MFMIITSPWPVPSANAELAEFASAVADTHLPGAVAETGTSPPADRLEELVWWSRRERLRLLWYRFRLTSSGIYRVSRQAGERL